MDIRIDPRRKIPLSQQIRDEIWMKINNGDLHEGDILPAVRALALVLDVNFNTVARAYRALDQIGCITTQQGRGTYVIGISKTPDVDITSQPEPSAGYLYQLWNEQAQQYGLTITDVLLAQAKQQHRDESIKVKKRCKPKRICSPRKLLRLFILPDELLRKPPHKKNRAAG